ncbi:hypothetical protein [Paenibacillus sp. 1781tsa1]|uniref:hypothetical protein n=1 Tax=Paenibacillus sp. 1781tsa1 TaxID=2953810 RepID=UPI0020A079B5|nr:hypothetical protein [Paenibacillus sp. 1781tsa1]MCP1182623.1 hypothetical protein [Paenibacillus sp. 1781tsa1]
MPTLDSYSLYNFRLDGEGMSGNAVAGDIREGKTAKTDTGNVTGTLAEHKTNSITPSKVVQNFPAGIYPSFNVQPSSANYVFNNTSTSIYIPGNSMVDLPLPVGISEIVAVSMRADGYSGADYYRKAFNQKLGNYISFYYDASVKTFRFFESGGVNNTIYIDARGGIS